MLNCGRARLSFAHETKDTPARGRGFDNFGSGGGFALFRQSPGESGLSSFFVFTVAAGRERQKSLPNTPLTDADD